MLGGRSKLGAELGLVLLFGTLLVLGILIGVFLGSLGARGETGTPALELDGIYRAQSDWVVEAEDGVLYENATIEASGNLTVASGGRLTLRNVTLDFTAPAAAERHLRVEAQANLSVSTTTLRALPTRFAIQLVGGGLEAQFSSFVFSSAPSVPAAIHVIDGRLSLINCLVVTDAERAVVAERSTFHAVEADFVDSADRPAGVAIAGDGSYVFDTTRMGDLASQDVGSAQFFATLRFTLRAPDGSPVAGRVNGTGLRGEIFAVEANASGMTTAVRLLWLDLAPPPPLLTAANRSSPLPVRATAVGQGIGGNNSAVTIRAERLNTTLVLDHPYDLAITLFVVNGHVVQGPGLRPAYYVNLNTAVDVLVRVLNRGEALSAAASLDLTQLALEPSSLAIQGSRPVSVLSLGPLHKGESANFSVPFIAGEYGGLLDRIGPCFRSVSFTSAMRVEVVDLQGGDFGPWNNARQFTMIAYQVTGNETGPCEQQNPYLVPALGLGAAAVLAAAWWITHFGSEQRRAQRLARIEDARKQAEPPDEERPEAGGPKPP